MKILIIYASAGAGHHKAAEALFNSFCQQKLAKISVQKIDALEYTNPFFKWSYPATYIFLVKYLAYFWGISFHLFNFPLLRPICSRLRHYFNYLQGRPLIEYLAKEKPDVVICVHFFSAELISRLKLTGQFKGQVICQITDFGVHQFWVNKGTDYYIVASEFTKTELKRKGVAENKILVFGIPIEQKFLKITAKTEVRLNLGLDKELLTVLVASGGFGVGPIKKIVQYLDDSKIKLQVIIICGKNMRLYCYFKQLNFKKTTKIFSYVNNMDEFMGISDLIITKSGGLTVSEALAKSLPMLIIKPIPGQEMKNADIVEKYEAGLRIRALEKLNKQLQVLLENDCQKLNKMRENARHLAKPEAANKISQWIIQNLSLKN